MTRITGSLTLPYSQPLTLSFESRESGNSMLPGLLYNFQTDLQGNYDFELPEGVFSFYFYGPIQGTGRPHLITVPKTEQVSLSQLLDPNYAPPIAASVDTTAPVVTGPSPITLEFPNGAGGLDHSNAQLNSWLETATATDETDSVAPAVINNLGSLANPLIAGTYTITFSANDQAGNIGTAQTVLTISEAPFIPVVLETFSFTNFEVI